MSVPLELISVDVASREQPPLVKKKKKKILEEAFLNMGAAPLIICYSHLLTGASSVIECKALHLVRVCQR